MPFASQNCILVVCTSTAYSTGTSAEVGYITGFSGPDGQAAEIDISSFESTAKEFVLGLSDEGNVSVDFRGEPTGSAGQANLISLKQSGDKTAVGLKLSDSSTTLINFDGYVKSYSLSGGVDDAVNGNTVIRITGAVTWTTV